LGTQCCGNYCCNQGSYCSKYGCIPVGSIECGGYYCTPGNKCASGRGCLAESVADCGNGRYCNPGYYCGRDGGCVPEGNIDCGSYNCAPGSRCSRNRQCLAAGAIECGSGSCPAGHVCTSDQKCMQQADYDAWQAREREQREQAAERRRRDIEARREAERRAEEERRQAEARRRQAEEQRLADQKRAEDARRREAVQQAEAAVRKQQRDEYLQRLREYEAKRTAAASVPARTPVNDAISAASTRQLTGAAAASAARTPLFDHPQVVPEQRRIVSSVPPTPWWRMPWRGQPDRTGDLATPTDTGLPEHLRKKEPAKHSPAAPTPRTGNDDHRELGPFAPASPKELAESERVARLERERQEQERIEKFKEAPKYWVKEEADNSCAGREGLWQASCRAGNAMAKWFKTPSVR
jgi:hypothetical protein